MKYPPKYAWIDAVKNNLFSTGLQLYLDLLGECGHDQVSIEKYKSFSTLTHLADAFGDIKFDLPKSGLTYILNNVIDNLLVEFEKDIGGASERNYKEKKSKSEYCFYCHGSLGSERRTIQTVDGYRLIHSSCMEKANNDPDTKQLMKTNKKLEESKKNKVKKSSTVYTQWGSFPGIFTLTYWYQDLSDKTMYVNKTTLNLAEVIALVINSTHENSGFNVMIVENNVYVDDRSFQNR